MTDTLVDAIAVVLAVLVAAVFTVVLARTGMPTGLVRLVRVKAFLSTFALVANYVSLYREPPTPFTASLLVFTVALLLYALSSNPLLWVLVGRPGRGSHSPPAGSSSSPTCSPPSPSWCSPTSRTGSRLRQS